MTFWVTKRSDVTWHDVFFFSFFFSTFSFNTDITWVIAIFFKKFSLPGHFVNLCLQIRTSKKNMIVGLSRYSMIAIRYVLRYRQCDIRYVLLYCKYFFFFKKHFHFSSNFQLPNIPWTPGRVFQNPPLIVPKLRIAAVRTIFKLQR